MYFRKKSNVVKQKSNVFEKKASVFEKPLSVFQNIGQARNTIYGDVCPRAVSTTDHAALAMEDMFLGC